MHAGARFVAVLLMCAFVLLAPPASAGAAAPESGVVDRYTATVTVEGDGSLQIDETIRYDLSQAPSAEVERTISTRQRFDEDDDRVYTLSDVRGTSDQGEVDVSVSEGESESTISTAFAARQSGRVTVSLHYRVAGAVSEVADGLELRWPVVQGFPQRVTEASVTWEVPGLLWLTCLTGEPGSGRLCTTAEMVEVARPTMTERDVGVGEQVVGILGLSRDAGIAADAELEARWSLTRAFSAEGAPLWIALAVVGLGLLAAFALWWSRGRDQGGRPSTPMRPLSTRPDGTVVLSTPGAVRPGQMGTLVDEHVDAVDVSSTILDLATRNYLFIEELPQAGYGRRDWILRRRNDAGDELIRYEREIFQCLFSAAAEVRVSEVGPLLRGRLPSIQAQLYDDMVEQGWFAERPDTVRGRWTTAGWVLVAAGVVLSVVLALVSSFGLVGLAVVLAGVALAGAGQLAPARTATGSTMLGELAQFRTYLAQADVSDVPPEQREELISRLYPYALVFGLGERWAAALAATDTDPDPDDPLYWYGAPADWHLSDAAPSLGELSAALSAAIGSRQLLSAH